MLQSWQVVKQLPYNGGVIGLCSNKYAVADYLDDPMVSACRAAGITARAITEVVATQVRVVSFGYLCLFQLFMRYSKEVVATQNRLRESGYEALKCPLLVSAALRMPCLTATRLCPFN